MALCACGIAPNITAFVLRESVVLVSGHGGVPPCPITTKLSRDVRDSRDTCPLRPPASLLHKAAFWKVLASRCAKAPLGVAHRFAPWRVSKIGLMQSGLRWCRRVSRRRSPVAGAPYAPPTGRPCACRGWLVWSGAPRYIVCQWPAASLRCVPPPTLRALPASRALVPRGLPVRPPRGLPQPARLSYWELLQI